MKTKNGALAVTFIRKTILKSTITAKSFLGTSSDIS
jgi:hypothetical protein